MDYGQGGEMAKRKRTKQHKKSHRQPPADGGNGRSKHKQTEIINGISKNVNGSVERVARAAPFILIDRSPPEGYWLLGNLWEKPGQPNLITARTDIPRLPIGGHVGTIVIADLETGQIIAEYAPWAKWDAFKNYHNLVKIDGSLWLEIEIAVFQEALKSEVVML